MIAAHKAYAKKEMSRIAREYLRRARVAREIGKTFSWIRCAPFHKQRGLVNKYIAEQLQYARETRAEY